MKAGDRVKLLAVRDLPEEYGTLLSNRPWNGTVIVEIDQKYRTPHEDGLREVLVKEIELCPNEKE